MLSLSFIVLLAVGNFALGFLAALVLAGTVAHHDEHESLAGHDDHLESPPTVDATDIPPVESPSSAVESPPAAIAESDPASAHPETPVAVNPATSSDNAVSPALAESDPSAVTRNEERAVSPTQDRSSEPGDQTVSSTDPVSASAEMAKENQIEVPSATTATDAPTTPVSELAASATAWQAYREELLEAQRQLSEASSDDAVALRAAMTAGRDLAGGFTARRDPLLAIVGRLSSGSEAFSQACGSLEIMLGSAEDTSLDAAAVSPQELSDENLARAASQMGLQLGTLASSCENICGQLSQLEPIALGSAT